MGLSLSKKSRKSRRKNIDCFRTKMKLLILSLPLKASQITIDEFTNFTHWFDRLALSTNGKYIPISILAEELLLEDPLPLQEWLNIKYRSTSPQGYLSLKDTFFFLHNMAYPLLKLPNLNDDINEALLRNTWERFGGGMRWNVVNTTLSLLPNKKFNKSIDHQIEFPFELVFNLFSTTDLIDIKNALNSTKPISEINENEKSMTNISLALLLKWLTKMEKHIGCEAIKTLDINQMHLDLITTMAYALQISDMDYKSWKAWLIGQVTIVTSSVIPKYIRFKFFSSDKSSANSFSSTLRSPYLPMLDELVSQKWNPRNNKIANISWSKEATRKYTKIHKILDKVIPKADASIIWFLLMTSLSSKYVVFYRPRVVCLFSTYQDGISLNTMRHYIEGYNAPTILIIHTHEITNNESSGTSILAVVIASSWKHFNKPWPITLKEDNTYLFMVSDEVSSTIFVDSIHFNTNNGIALCSTRRSDIDYPIGMSNTDAPFSHLISNKLISISQIELYLTPDFTTCYIRNNNSWIEMFVIRLSVYGLGDLMTLENWAEEKKFGLEHSTHSQIS